MLESHQSQTYSFSSKSQFCSSQFFLKTQGFVLIYVFNTRASNFVELFSTTSTLEFHHFYIFRIFEVGPTHPQRELQGNVMPCCADPPSHTTTLMVVFWSSPWSPAFKPCSSQPPSYHRSHFDPWFDLGLPGSHLEPHQKLVPVLRL